MTDREAELTAEQQQKIESLLSTCGGEAAKIHAFITENIPPSMGALLALVHLASLSAVGSVQPPMSKEFWLQVCGWTYDVAEHLTATAPSNDNAVAAQPAAGGE